MAKVRCKFCKFEQQRKCMKKKVTVGLNKKRVCQTYQGDEDKVSAWVSKRQNSSKPEVILRPDGLWSKEARRAEKQKVMENNMKQFESTVEAPKPGSKHPSTGDLSRFLTTQETPQPKKTGRIKIG